MENKIKFFLEELKLLTLLEATQLVKAIETTFQVDITPDLLPTVATAIPALEIIEEKITFNVILSEVPMAKKIAILKIVRAITGLGLKESKDIVDNVPKLLKEGLTKEDSGAILKEIEALGGKVIIT